jgi:hypothetical protein
MMKINRTVFINLMASAILVLAVTSCAPAAGTPTNNPPTNEATPPSDASPTVEGTITQTPATADPPGGVTIQGDVNLNFQATAITAVPLIDTVVISLLDTDQATGVILFVPMDIQPGTYPIGDLYNQSDADVTARFDSLQDSTLTSYESIGGTLTLTETGASFSGTFTFEALRKPDGAGSITVTGSFEGAAVLGQ